MSVNSPAESNQYLTLRNPCATRDHVRCCGQCSTAQQLARDYWFVRLKASWTFADKQGLIPDQALEEDRWCEPCGGEQTAGLVPKFLQNEFMTLAPTGFSFLSLINIVCSFFCTILCQPGSWSVSEKRDGEGWGRGGYHASSSCLLSAEAHKPSAARY